MNAQKTGQWRWVAVGGERVAYYVGVIRGVFQNVARVFQCVRGSGARGECVGDASQPLPTHSLHWCSSLAAHNDPEDV